MDWPLPKLDEAGIREKEREAAEHYGRGEMARVAKMYQHLGDLKRATDCYNLAQLPAKARRVQGERVYNTEETLSCSVSLEGPTWYRTDQGAAVDVSLMGELWSTLGDPYEAILAYLDAGISPPFKCWKGRGALPEVPTDAADKPAQWFLKPSVHPRLGGCGWDLAWSADLADRDGKPTVASAIRDQIARARKTDSADLQEADDILEDADRHFERGILSLALEAYTSWRPHLHHSDIPAHGLFLAPVLFYTARDMDRALRALKEWRAYASEHPKESPGPNHHGLARLEVMALMHLGRHEEAADCFQGLIHATASNCDWDSSSWNYSIYTYEEDLSALATLRQHARDSSGRDEALRAHEAVCRCRGQWVDPAVEYYFRGMLDQMERVCREEDELDVAAHLYQRAGQIGESERILASLPPRTEAKSCEEGPVPGRVEISDRNCSQCGAKVCQDDSFCSDCGCPLRQICSRCGSETGHGKKFCRNCGMSLN